MARSHGDLMAGGLPCGGHTSATTGSSGAARAAAVGGTPVWDLMSLPVAGRPLVGCGYRFPLSDCIPRNLHKIDVVEILIDDYFLAEDRHKRLVRNLVGKVPLTAHGLGLSIGTAAHPDGAYLERVAQFLKDFNISCYSEHIAFTRARDSYIDDLLPLPRTMEAASHLVQNIRFVQSFMPGTLLFENISAYFEYPDSEFSEAEFLNRVCGETGAGILLDVENLYANSINLGVRPEAFIDELAAASVLGMHVAGGRWCGNIFFDNHCSSIPEGALRILNLALEKFSTATIVVERDRNLGDGSELLADVERVRACLPANIEADRVDAS